MSKVQYPVPCSDDWFAPRYRTRSCPLWMARTSGVKFSRRRPYAGPGEQAQAVDMGMHGPMWVVLSAGKVRTQGGWDPVVMMEVPSPGPGWIVCDKENPEYPLNHPWKGLWLKEWEKIKPKAEDRSFEDWLANKLKL